MNRTIFTCLFIFINLQAYCQSVICNNAFTRVYVGIGNPISAVAENTDCDNLFLKTDNGKLSKSSGACSYDWVPAHVGIGTLTLYKIRKNDTIFYGSKMFRVISIPLDLYLYGSNDSISIKYLSEIKKPFLFPAREGTTYCGLNIMASNYSIIAKRGNELLFYKENIGMEFTQETLDLFKTLQKNDILLFFDFKLWDFFESYKPSSYQFVTTE